MSDWWSSSFASATAAKSTRGRIRVDPCESVARNLHFLLLRPLRVRIIIKPAPRLPPVPPRHHHPLQQRRRRKPPLLELVIHHLRNVISRVEPHKIQQRE